MNHLYSHEGTEKTPVWVVMKWLRQNGKLDTDYRIVQANYRRVMFEFFDKKLELMYTMQYTWGNN